MRYSFRFALSSTVCDSGARVEGVGAVGKLALGVTGREFSALRPVRRDDCALLFSEPFRERYGELEPLASTHSSSGSSLPRSKCTWVLLGFSRLSAAPPGTRLSFSDDLCRLPNSTLDRFRFKLVCDTFLVKLPPDRARGSLMSLVDLRCDSTCEEGGSVGSRLGEVGPECERLGCLEEWPWPCAWYLGTAFEDGTRVCRRPTWCCFWRCFVRWWPDVAPDVVVVSLCESLSRWSSGGRFGWPNDASPRSLS